jgi:hypothetical protein
MTKINYNLFISNEFEDRKNHRFFVKTTEFDDQAVYWQFSCGCDIFLTGHANDQSTFSSFALEKMKNKFETSFLDIPENCWPKEHFESDHFCCPKDPKLVERLSFIWDIDQEEFYEKEGYAAVEESKDMVDILLRDPTALEKILESKNKPLNLRDFFSEPASADELKRRFKNPKKLSEICRKTIKQQNKKRKFIPLTYGELNEEYGMEQAKKKQRISACENIFM